MYPAAPGSEARSAVFLLALIAVALGGTGLVFHHVMTTPDVAPRSVFSAVVTANATGPYVIVRFNAPDDVWVYGVVVTRHTWLAEGEINPDYVLTHYRVYRIDREVRAGPHTLVIRLNNTWSKWSYPVWHGMVVVGSNTYKLSDFGEVRMYAKPNVTVVGLVYVKVIYAYHDNPIIIKSDINLTDLDREAGDVVRNNASIEALADFARRVANTLLESMREGRTVIGYPDGLYSYDVFNPNFTRQEIDRGMIGVEVKVSAWRTLVVGEVVRKTEIGVFKYFIDKTWYGTVTYDTFTGKVRDVHTKNETELETGVPVPAMDKFAVIILYAKTPYSPAEALGTIAVNEIATPRK